MRLDGERMIIGIKDLRNLLAITIVTGCAVFVCSLFLNYHMDVVTIKNLITTPQGMIMYDALISSGKVTVSVSGGCLIVTTVIMLIFYVKNYIDSHGKELGILKALGYSNFKIAKHFWVFGVSVLFVSVLGCIGACAYMPAFYEAQNSEGLFPKMLPQFHLMLAFCLIVLPTMFFMFVAMLYAFFKLKSPVIALLKERQKISIKKAKKEGKESSFLSDLRKNTLGSRKILVFFIGFSAFCFSSMTQMSMSIDDLASENFSWMMILIGMILAFMTLLMSLTSVVKANIKTIAMMKVFGYSQKECSRSIFGGYRPVSYIGFVIGTVYQCLLLRITVDVIFADFENMPVYRFDYKSLAVSFVTFIVSYECVIYGYSRKIGKQSLKSIMLE